MAGLREVASLLPTIVFSCNAGGECDFVNERFIEVTGLPVERVLGFGWRDVVDPHDAPGFERALQDAAGASRAFEYRLRLRNAQGSSQWFIARFRPILDTGGELAHWIGTAADIDELVRAEQALAQRTEELTRSNAEFEYFASIVSHDLRSPLLSLTGCVELLSEQYQGQLGPDADELIGFVTASVGRMNDMIKGLLDYSRVGSRDLLRDSCDLEAVLQQTTTALSSLIQSSHARITHDPLPVVHGDPSRLGQVFQNLIENAIKYRSSDPIIHISAQRSPEGWIISVVDNGIGVAPEHAERIFKVFQRLHGDDSKYKGTGMGLAIARKIVERHGGRIWVESAGAGNGSAFKFILPA